MTPPTNILLTGAAGRIGRAFREHTSDRYRLRLADRDMGKLGDPHGHAVFALDVADLAACQAACAGMDVVIHLSTSALLGYAPQDDGFELYGAAPE